MKKKLKRNKAFTLIELLIVIAVLSILVLLAVPKLLGYTKDAKLAQIQNDVRVNENMIQVKTLKNDELTKDWEIVESSLIEEYKNDSSLFNKKGLVSSNEILDDEFLSIPEEFIDSKLKGDFLYAAKGGLIYYHTDEKVEQPKGDKEAEDDEGSEDTPEPPKEKNWEEIYSNELVLKSWHTAMNSSTSEVLRIYNYGERIWVYAYKDGRDFINLDLPVDFKKYEYRINVLEAESGYSMMLDYKGSNKPVGAVNVYPIESNSVRDLFSFSGWGNPNNLNVKYDNRIKFKIERNLLESDEDQDHIDTNPQISCFVETEFESPQSPKLLGNFKLNVKRDHFISLNKIDIWHNPESPNFRFGYSDYPYGSDLPSINLLSGIKKDVPTGELKAWNYSFQYKLSGNNFYSGGPADIDVYRIYDHIPRFEGTPTVKATSSEKRKMTKLEISGLALDINSRNTGKAESLMLSYDVRNSEIKNKGLGCLQVNRQANFNEISYIDEELPAGNYQLTLSIKNAKGQTSSRSISFNVEKGDF